MFRFLFCSVFILCSVFCEFAYCAVLMVVSRIKCTGETSIVPTEGNFPVVCVNTAFEGTMYSVKEKIKSQLISKTLHFSSFFLSAKP